MQLDKTCFFLKLEAESVGLKLPSAKPLKILTRTKHTQTLPRRRASICSNLDKMGTAKGDSCGKHQTILKLVIGISCSFFWF